MGPFAAVFLVFFSGGGDPLRRDSRSPLSFASRTQTSVCAPVPVTWSLAGNGARAPRLLSGIRFSFPPSVSALPGDFTEGRGLPEPGRRAQSRCRGAQASLVNTWVKRTVFRRDFRKKHLPTSAEVSAAWDNPPVLETQVGINSSPPSVASKMPGFFFWGKPYLFPPC